MLQPQLFGPFRNEGLFADHYLQDVLPKTPELWDTEGLEGVREELLALWQDQAGQVAHYSEAQLEDTGNLSRAMAKRDQQPTDPQAAKLQALVAAGFTETQAKALPNE